MRIQAGNLLRGLIPVVLLLAGTVVLCGEEAESAVAESSAISIRSAPIEGKIFLLTQERGQEEVAGANVYIRIRRPRERAFLYETKTLKDGSYEIPGLEPEDYHMLVGDLRLDLKVFPKTEERPDFSRNLIIMIPVEMAGPGAGKAAEATAQKRP